MDSKGSGDAVIELRVIDAIADAFVDRLTMADYAIESRTVVFKRSLDGTDPNVSIGVTFTDWEQAEPMDIGMNEPAQAHYGFSIQSLLKHTRREHGEHIGAVMAARIRRMLYRDEVLRVSLHSISVTDGDVTERVLKVKVLRQECLDTSFKGGFAFMSQTDFQVTTEIT